MMDPKLPLLVCTVGLPRAGKSTWAHAQGVPVVNPDAIRLAIHGPHRFIERAEPFVWATAKLMVRSLFLAGHPAVILDATNTTRKRRKEWLQADTWRTEFWFVPATPGVCLARCDNDPEMMAVVRRMESTFEFIGDDEPLFSGAW